MYTGFFLEKECRSELIEQIPFVFEKEIAEHITLVFGKHSQEFFGVTCEVYAVVTTANMQYLLCKVNGEKVRADGIPYHITWSISSTCKPKDTGLHAKQNYSEIQQDIKCANSCAYADFQVWSTSHLLRGHVDFRDHSKKK